MGFLKVIFGYKDCYSLYLKFFLRLGVKVLFVKLVQKRMGQREVYFGNEGW